MSGLSLDLEKENIDKLKELFPAAVEEGKIDFDMLRSLLGDEVDDSREKYQFTWNGKAKAIKLAQTPSSATLRPCNNEKKSKNWNNTENLYIEGDNLEVLKQLQKTYYGKIRMIYIDPPYNTGTDFVYHDNFEDSLKNYKEVTNQKSSKIESSGKIHTKWLNMIYPRLKIARDLLSEEGIIFISIDDNEYSNLKKICDEIFGEQHFVSNIVWQSTIGSNTGENTIITVTENILCYSKTNNPIINKEKFINDGKMTYKDEYFERRGYYALYKLDSTRQASHYSDALNYPIECPDGTIQYPGGETFKQDGWNYLWSKNKVEWGLNNGYIVFKKNGEKWTIYNKRYELVDNNDNFINRGTLFKNLILSSFCTTSTGSKDVSSLFGEKTPFDYPKPVKLLKKLCELGTNANDIVLDFFSGSATTADAIMQLNQTDGGKRKFILIQVPEIVPNDSQAKRLGYATIADVGEERIRRAGKRIKEEHPEANIDAGFRVFKLDSSNMQNTYYNPAEVMQSLLDQTIDNIKPDRTAEDLLFQVMLELGIELSADIQEKNIRNKKVYVVNGNDIIACFDDNISNEAITEIAKQNPLYAVFKDKSFATDSVGINNEQIFKTYSPATIIKVI